MGETALAGWGVPYLPTQMLNPSTSSSTTPVLIQDPWASQNPSRITLWPMTFISGLYPLTLFEFFFTHLL